VSTKGNVLPQYLGSGDPALKDYYLAMFCVRTKAAKGRTWSAWSLRTDTKVSRDAVPMTGHSSALRRNRGQSQLRRAFVFTNPYALLQPEVLVGHPHEKFDADSRLAHEATRDFLAPFLQRFTELIASRSGRGQDHDITADRWPALPSDAVSARRRAALILGKTVSDRRTSKDFSQSAIS
jgi:hypothetical protein